MYQGFSKDDGAVIGPVGKQELVDFTEASLTTSGDEALVCAAEDENGEAVKIVAFSSLNALDGSVQWFHDETGGDRIMKRTMAMSQMSSMLHDTDRNRTYEKAIEKCIKHFAATFNRPPSVLDVGSGTGLLSMFCARHGASSVIGCEMFDALAGVAAHVVSSNNMEDIVQIVNAKSSDLDLGGGMMDILVSETLDSALLGESCLLSHADAIDRLIYPSEAYEQAVSSDNTASPLSDRVIPHDATVYGTLVESKTIRDMYTIPTLSLDGSSIPSVSPLRSEEAWECCGGRHVVPIHWDKIASPAASPVDATGHSNTALTDEPVAIMNIEFFHSLFAKDLLEEEDIRKQCTETFVTVARDGQVDGVLLWWKVNMLSKALDPKRECWYSTEPKVMNWQDHWIPVVFPLAKPLTCVKGDVVSIVAAHDHIHIWLDASVVKTTDSASGSIDIAIPKKQKVDKCVDEDDNDCCLTLPSEAEQCQCGWHLLCGPERMQMLNDASRTSLWDRAVHTIMTRWIDQHSVVVKESSIEQNTLRNVIMDVSDGSVLALKCAAVLSRFYNSSDNKIKSMVVSLECKDFSRMFHDQLVDANGLENEMIVWDGDNWNDVHNSFEVDEEANEESSTAVDEEIEVVDEADVNLTGSTNGLQISLLISECFYYQLHAQPTWQAFSFLYKRNELADLGALHTSVSSPHRAIICPSQAFVMAAAVQLSDLQVSHGLAGSVCGLDHSVYDETITDWHQHYFPYKLQGYDNTFLTKPVCVGMLDYEAGAVVSPVGATSIESASSSHAFEVTIDFLSQSTSSQRCDCVVLWVDYQLTPKSDASDPLMLCNCTDSSAFPPYYTTLIKFFPTPVFIKNTTDQKSQLISRVCYSKGDSDFTYEFEIKHNI